MRLVPLVLAAMLVATPLRAADPLTEAIGVSYADYRAALFRTNNGPPDAALAAIRATAAGWRDLAARVATPMPEPYARETGWPALAARVLAVLGKAEAEALAGQLPQAHETLEEIRDLLGDLRARNNVRVFSDMMNAFHEAMERAAPLAAQGPSTLAEQRELAGVLVHLAAGLLPGAPLALRQDSDFLALEAANRAAVMVFRDATRSGDAAAIRAAAERLRQPYSRLFLRYG